MTLSAKLGKKSETPLFGQILNLIPNNLLTTVIDKNSSDKHCSKYKTNDQLVSMMFGQLNKCLSLREIGLGIGNTPEFITDIGLKQSPARSTMSDGNAKRDYKVFEDLYTGLIDYYKSVYSKRPEYKAIQEIKGKNIKIIDATTMSVCLKLFDWANFRTAKGGIKAHVSLDEATMVPDMVNITEAKISDRRGCDNFRYEKDTIVVDDRGYFDFNLFRVRIDDKNHLVTRIKSNILYQSVIEMVLPADKDEHILKDEIIKFTSLAAEKAGMKDVLMRRVAVFIPQDNRTVELITNNMMWSAATIAELYRRRWLVETFFKLIKQNLQIKSFLGTSPNACKSQIFIGLITYFILELIRRTISIIKHKFGHFVTLIRICLTQYHGLEYIVNGITDTVKKGRQKHIIKENPNQQTIKFKNKKIIYSQK
jgi:hypothetical protein